MRKAIIIILLFISSSGFTQTNIEIAKNMLGHTISEITPELDSLNILYFVNYPDEFKGLRKTVTISVDGKNAVLFVLKTKQQSRRVYEILINYRHDNLEHAKELQSLKKYKKHIGVYSTDVIITQN